MLKLLLLYLLILMKSYFVALEGCKKKCPFWHLAKLSSSGKSNVFISNRAKKQYASKIYKGGKVVRVTIVPFNLIVTATCIIIITLAVY